MDIQSDLWEITERHNVEEALLVIEDVAFDEEPSYCAAELEEAIETLFDYSREIEELSDELR